MGKITNQLTFLHSPPPPTPPISVLLQSLDQIYYVKLKLQEAVTNNARSAPSLFQYMRLIQQWWSHRCYLLAPVGGGMSATPVGPADLFICLRWLDKADWSSFLFHARRWVTGQRHNENVQTPQQSIITVLRCVCLHNLKGLVRTYNTCNVWFPSGDSIIVTDCDPWKVDRWWCFSGKSAEVNKPVS